MVHAGEENPKFSLITDGGLHLDILEIIGKDEECLVKGLKKQGIESVNQVLLGEYIDANLYITTY